MAQKTVKYSAEKNNIVEKNIKYGLKKMNVINESENFSLTTWQNVTLRITDLYYASVFELSLAAVTL